MSDRKTLRLASVAAIALAPFVLAGAANAQGYTPSTAKGDWPMYFADPSGSRYSPQDQINASNFNKLEVAWRFKTDNLAALDPDGRLDLVACNHRPWIGRLDFDLHAEVLELFFDQARSEFDGLRTDRFQMRRGCVEQV